MATVFKIHPAIGIARLGNSEEFYVAPDAAGGLPVDTDGNSIVDFRDDQGRLKRQAARFRIFVYDDQTPEGRELQAGDSVQIDGKSGTLKEVQWTVYLANKKAVWYEFKQLEGEHGYSTAHPLRNSVIANPEDRKKLIVDPGPLTLLGPDQHAAFAKGAAQDKYPQTFPPADLQPFSIDTLGEIQTDAEGRLLVLGGRGHSGSTINPPPY